MYANEQLLAFGCVILLARNRPSEGRWSGPTRGTVLQFNRKVRQITVIAAGEVG